MAGLFNDDVADALQEVVHQDALKTALELFPEDLRDQVKRLFLKATVKGPKFPPDLASQLRIVSKDRTRASKMRKSISKIAPFLGRPNRTIPLIDNVNIFYTFLYALAQSRDGHLDLSETGSKTCGERTFFDAAAHRFVVLCTERTLGVKKVENKAFALLNHVYPEWNDENKKDLGKVIEHFWNRISNKWARKKSLQRQIANETSDSDEEEQPAQQQQQQQQQEQQQQQQQQEQEHREEEDEHQEEGIDEPNARRIRQRSPSEPNVVEPIECGNIKHTNTLNSARWFRFASCDCVDVTDDPMFFNLFPRLVNVLDNSKFDGPNLPCGECGYDSGNLPFSHFVRLVLRSDKLPAGRWIVLYSCNMCGTVSTKKNNSAVDGIYECYNCARPEAIPVKCIVQARHSRGGKEVKYEDLNQMYKLTDKNLHHL